MSAEVAALRKTRDAGEPQVSLKSKPGANHEALDRALCVEHFQFEPVS